MMTSTILLLLVAAASTIAFSPPSEYRSLIDRRRRDISSGSKSGSGTGAVAFSGSSSSSSSSGAGNGFATSISSRSGFPSNEGSNSVGAGVYNSVNPGAYGSNDFNFPNPAYNQYPNQYGGGYPDFNRFFQEYMAFMQRLAQQQAAYVPNEIHSRGAFGPDDFTGAQNGFYFPGPNNYGGNYGGNFGGNPNDGNVHASASASLTPRGGFGSASISPPPQGDPGLATRMGSVPSSGGGNFAVFSSSSSGSSDVNGERKTYKEATSVINDNGKVTTFHVSDP